MHKKTKFKRLKFQQYILNPMVTFLVELVFAITSFLPLGMDIIGVKVGDLPAFAKWTILFVWGVALILLTFVNIQRGHTLKEFQLFEKQQELSHATLLAQQNSNSSKTRSVLQITYGRVPEWHPFNYRDNVLVYDIHEHLRTILIDLRDAIRSTMANNMDFDAITVDLVYCYPDEEYNGIIPVPHQYTNAWRIITSGDVSGSHDRLHDFLENNESFYAMLKRENYVFWNDKLERGRFYIPSGKDYEYSESGSIVGFVLNIKNDIPECVLVKAMLTITTYGKKLCGDNDLVGEADYGKLFKCSMVNVYKTLLESELSQMYIRHAIKDGQICPETGRKIF